MKEIEGGDVLLLEHSSSLLLEHSLKEETYTQDSRRERETSNNLAFEQKLSRMLYGISSSFGKTLSCPSFHLCVFRIPGYSRRRSDCKAIKHRTRREKKIEDEKKNFQSKKRRNSHSVVILSDSAITCQVFVLETVQVLLCYPSVVYFNSSSLLFWTLFDVCMFLCLLSSSERQEKKKVVINTSLFLLQPQHTNSSL